MKDHPASTPPGGKKRQGNRNGKWKVHSQNEQERFKNTPGTRVKIVESPVLVPYTRDSKLRKALQVLDDTLGVCMGTPRVRFVERCGGQTLVELLGSSNPWARALKCRRITCLPCMAGTS